MWAVAFCLHIFSLSYFYNVSMLACTPTGYDTIKVGVSNNAGREQDDCEVGVGCSKQCSKGEGQEESQLAVALQVLVLLKQL